MTNPANSLDIVVTGTQITPGYIYLRNAFYDIVLILAAAYQTKELNCFVLFSLTFSPYDGRFSLLTDWINVAILYFNLISFYCNFVEPFF